MKRLYILWILSCVLLACTDVTVDYSYSPSSPRAGQVVTFTNLSTDGEEWLWTFGDGVTSTLKSPTHTYKQPGTYQVSLQVDGRASYTRLQQITVLDTVPSFSCDDTTQLQIFSDLSFQAEVYNPYSYAIDYQWTITPDVRHTLLSDTNTLSTFQLYFAEVCPCLTVQLRVILQGDTTYVRHSYTIRDRATTSVLMRTPSTDYQQRIFSPRFEAPSPLTYAPAVLLLDNTQDTLQLYNSRTFRLSELRSTLNGITGFRIVNRKIYFRTDEGLFVANIDGSNCVQISALPTSALTIDTQLQRLYWAQANGVYYMPLIGSENNRFVTTPTQLNSLSGVYKLTIDPTLR